jgi:hypothetical protein
MRLIWTVVEVEMDEGWLASPNHATGKRKEKKLNWPSCYWPGSMLSFSDLNPEPAAAL